MGVYTAFGQYVTTIYRMTHIPSYRIRLHGDRKEFQSLLNIFRNQELFYFFSKQEKRIVVVPYPKPEKGKRYLKIAISIKDRRGNLKKVLDRICDDLDGNILETSDNVIVRGGFSHSYIFAEFPDKNDPDKVKEYLCKEVDEIYKSGVLLPEVEPIELDLSNYQRFEPPRGRLRFVPEGPGSGGYLPVDRRLLRALGVLKSKEKDIFCFLRARLEDRVLDIEFPTSNYPAFPTGLYAEIGVYFVDKKGSLRDMANFISNRLEINILKGNKRVLMYDHLSKWVIVGDLIDYARKKSLKRLDNVKKQLMTDLLEYRKIIVSDRDLRAYKIIKDKPISISFMG